MNKTIQITFKDILLAFLAVIGLILLLLIKDVIIGMFVSIIFATALNPLVNIIQKAKIPRSLAIFIVYLLIIGLFSTLISTIIPPLVNQTINLINSLPLNTVSEYIKPFEVNLENIQLITSQLGSVATAWKLITSTFSSIVAVVTFSVITYYLLIERNQLHKYLVGLFGETKAEIKAEKFVDRVEHQIGSWVRGQITLMIIVGVITYIGLRLLNIQFALTLAIIAGLLEIIPNIGPTVSAIPAIATPLLMGQNPIMSLFVAALYVLVQQLENNIIVPQVMRTAVGVHPLVTILLIIIGLKLAGIGGAILAVPTFLVFQLAYKDILKPYFKSN